MTYGFLYEIGPNEDVRQYVIEQDRVLIGRGADCDVRLRDATVSRHQAFLTFGSLCHVVDLGSANVTHVNDRPIGRDGVVLANGDIIKAGASSLRFAIAAPAGQGEQSAARTADLATAVMTGSLGTVVLSAPAESLRVEAQANGDATIAVVLSQHDEPCLLLREAAQTQVFPIRNLPWTIGRAATCTIRLGDTHASREHARLDAAGEDFVLHDLNSANGTTVNGLRIRDCKIADGDTIRICDAALVVRLGSRPVTDAPRSQPDRRMPVVLVPGLCGSELLMGRITMWPNVLRSLSCPEESIPEYWGALQIGSAVRETVVIPGLVKMEAFGRLVDFLCQELDYADGVDLVEFAYDWRQDNRQSAGLLKERVATWRKGLPDPQTKIVFIAHSMGGLICRYFLEHLGGADLCDRLILLGTPNRGSTRIFSTTIFGRGALAFPIGGSRIRRMMQHFPSVYQLLPTYTSIRLDDGSTFLPYADDQWLSAEFRPMLESGRSFRKELTATERATVPTTCVFGYGQRTLAGITVSRERDGTLKLLDEQFENAGDDSVTENSAVLDRAEIHPVRQRHGALYADKDVQRRLRYELLERHRRG